MIHSYSGFAPDIVLPESDREKWKNLLDCIAINGFDGICAISNLEEFQKQPKHWPEHTNIPRYCLYLGSLACPVHGPVDLYSYRDWSNPKHYSTGIVFGNEDSEYMSGWVGVRLHDSEHGGLAYDELWMREFKCGLLMDEWIAEEAAIGLAQRARKRSFERIHQARKEKQCQKSQ